MKQDTQLMKLCTVVGARPQFVKASTVSRALARMGGVTEVLLHTGQHYDDNMSDVFFLELGIDPPKHNLQVGSGSHGKQTAEMLAGIESIILSEQPDCLLVYGDTNSTIAGALAATKLHVPVAHVEAGLRSFNKRMPEEINRIATDHISDLLYCPTQTSKNNLLNEGISEDKIFESGDVMYDASLYFGELSESKSSIIKELGIDKPFVLATIHRAENTDIETNLRNIFSAFGMVSREIAVVMPLHPRTKYALEKYQIQIPKNVIVTPPLGYLDMTKLEKNADCIATDSGGVQKEAFFHGRPSVTIRRETEWVELVEAGWNEICEPTSADLLAGTIIKSIGKTGDKITPYGNGRASEIIAKSIVSAIQH